MPIQALTDASVIRAHVRESEQTARRLISRAAYLEKLAGRPRTGEAERLSLETTARDLRAAADKITGEICALCRQVTLLERAA